MNDMNEQLPQSSEDIDRLMAMHRVVEVFFPDDIAFILEQLHDEEDEISFCTANCSRLVKTPTKYLLDMA